VAEHGTLINCDEASRFIEQIQDPVTKSLVNMVFVSLKRVHLEQREFPKSDFDMLFLVTILTTSFRPPPSPSPVELISLG
jgi:hypothetical protein